MAKIIAISGEYIKKVNEMLGQKIECSEKITTSELWAIIYANVFVDGKLVKKQNLEIPIVK